ncbi:MAG: hydrogenase maturation nickel metallochaperone HypA [Deltaproteobacteria bacterium]|nr:hydrogenase maturation nickel metallochaperone HypA [Deltaproteobacteria bacterium]
MHELSIAVQIIEIVHKHLPADQNLSVKKIRLRVGEFTAIIPESLRLCIDTITRETADAGVELEIIEIPAQVKCRQCFSVSKIEPPYLICASCGSQQVDIISGRELLVENIEAE